MANASDILEGWGRPALVIDAKGGLSAANVLFHGVDVPVERLACLRPGERLQTPDDGGGLGHALEDVGGFSHPSSLALTGLTSGQTP